MEAEAELDSIPTAAMPLPDSSAAYDAHLHTFNHHHPPTAATSALRTPSTASKQLAVFLSVVGVDLEGYTTTSVKARQVQQKSRTGFFGKIKRKVQDKVKQVAAGGAARPPSVGLCHIRSFVSDSEAHPFLTEEECYAGIRENTLRFLPVHRTEPRATGANVDFAVCALLSLPPPPMTSAFKFELWVELAGVETLVATAACGGGELVLCSDTGGYPIMLSGTLDGTADSKLVVHAKPSARLQHFNTMITTCWMGQTYRLDTGTAAAVQSSSSSSSGSRRGGSGGSGGKAPSSTSSLPPSPSLGPSPAAEAIVHVKMEAQEELSESLLAWVLPAHFLALRADDLQDELAKLQGKIGEVSAVLMDSTLPDVMGSSGGGGMADGGGVINASRTPQEHDKLQKGWAGTVAALEDLTEQASANIRNYIRLFEYYSQCSDPQLGASAVTCKKSVQRKESALRSVATNLHIHTIVIKAAAAGVSGGGGGIAVAAKGTSVGNLVDLAGSDASTSGSSSAANPLHTAVESAATAAAAQGGGGSPEKGSAGGTGLARMAPGEVKGFSTITCGAPVAHVLGMVSGGVAAMEEKLEVLLNSLREEEVRAAEEECRDVALSSLATTAAPGGILHLSAGTSIKSMYSSGRPATEVLQTIATEIAVAKLTFATRIRLDVVLGQTLGIVVTAFAVRIEELAAELDHIALECISEHGFLCSLESLLSTVGAEQKMIRDVEGGLRALQRSFTLGLANRDDGTSSGAAAAAAEKKVKEDRSSPINGTHRPMPDPEMAAAPVRVTRNVENNGFHVELLLPPALWAALPAAAQKGNRIPIVPVLFSQGVNEWQSLANLVGSNRLQHTLNKRALRALQGYASLYNSHTADHTSKAVARVRRRTKTLLSELDATIGKQQQAGKKEFGILAAAADCSRLLGGGRVIMCKSGKDRTAQAVTLETSRLLGMGGLKSDAQLMTTNLMREFGVRRGNVFKNTGSLQYAFNALQAQALPPSYRPPPSTLTGLTRAAPPT